MTYLGRELDIQHVDITDQTVPLESETNRI
jgi:hypothetical protein